MKHLTSPVAQIFNLPHRFAALPNAIRRHSRVQLCATLLFFLLAFSASAATRITATLTITNTPVNTNTLVVNSDTRTWTTNLTNSATQISATNSIGWSRTNLYLQIQAYPFTGPLVVNYGSTTNTLTFQAPVSTNLTITFGGTGWGNVTYSTSTVASSFPVIVPYTYNTNLGAQTNIFSLLASALGISTNRIPAGATALLHALTTVPTTNIFTNTIFQAPAITGGGLTNSAITNAPSISGSNIALVTGTLTNVTERMSTNVNAVIQGAREISGTIGSVTNGTIRGTVLTNVSGNMSNVVIHSLTVTNFDSPGLGNQSLQLGALSIANGAQSVGIGWYAVATNTGSIALGNSVTSYGSPSLGVGYGVGAEGNYSVAVGVEELYATGVNSIAVGSRSTASYVNSAVFGSYVDALAANHFAFGNTSNYFTFAGPIMGPVSSNALFKGYSTNTSSWTETSTAITSLANGHNIMSISDSASYFVLSGPSANWYLDAITNRWTDRVITLHNQSGYTMTLANESGFTSASDTRIANMTTADFPVGTNLTVKLKYLNSRWTVIGGSGVGNTNLYVTLADLNNTYLTNSITNIYNVAVSNATIQPLFRGIVASGPTNLHVAEFRGIEQGTNMVIYSTGTSVVFNASSSQTNTVITTNSTFAGALTNGYTLDFKTNFTATLAAANISIALREFVSTNITCGFSTLIQMAHGLPVTPTVVRAVLRNVVAERGWTAGDEVPITAIWYTGVSRPWGTVWANSTNVGVSVNNAPASSVEWVDKTGSLSTTTFTNTANWRLIIYARP